MNRSASDNLPRREGRSVIFMLAALLLAALVGLRPPAPALADECYLSDIYVDTAQELLEEIHAYSTTICRQKIILTDDITLRDNAIVLIDNNNPEAQLTIDGGFHTIDFEYEGEGFLISVDGSVTIQNITLANSDGSGIAVEEGNVRLLDSTIERSGSIGVYVRAGTVVIERSAILDGGFHGVQAADTIAPPTVWIINSTIARNSASGVSMYDGDIHLTHATVYGNDLGLHAMGGAVTVYNSILAGSGAADCLLHSPATLEIDHSLVQTNGFEGDDPCPVPDGTEDGNIVGADPLLAPLGNYGGPTLSMPPVHYTGLSAADSPVIDAGDFTLSLNENGNFLGTDQLGAGRNVGGSVNMGSVEGAVDITCSASMNVNSETALAKAIACFNRMPAGNYTIKFTANISLTTMLPEIENNNGATLLINGNGRALDAGGKTIAFFVRDSSKVSFEKITISGSFEEGIYAVRSTVHVRQSTIRDNMGEGIAMSEAHLVVRDSTFVGNRLNAIRFDAYNDSDTLHLINSTLYGNGLVDGDAGLVMFGGTTRVINSTIHQNGYGIRAFGPYVVDVLNSIVAGNWHGDCASMSGPTFFENSLLQENDSLDPCSASPGDDNVVGLNPQLGALGNNGGPTQTLPLLRFTGNITGNSPALNAGSDGVAADELGNPLAKDQRGAKRVAGGEVDMGAYEGTQQVNCKPFPRTVNNEATLNNAIQCFNALTTPGYYAINLSSNVKLNGSTVLIDNANEGVSLVIDGGGRSIDGQSKDNTRPLAIRPGTEVTLRNLTVINGNAAGDGGGIHNAGETTLSKVTVTDNTARTEGGGVYNRVGGVMLIEDSRVVNNLARSTAALDYADPVGGGISNEGEVTINDTLISNNYVDGHYVGAGGGIMNGSVMTINRSTIATNYVYAMSDSYGGGILNRDNLLIRDSTISGNQANSSNDRAASGGIHFEPSWHEGSNTPRLMIINSTISGNVASSQVDEAYGGGMWVIVCCGEIQDSVPVTLINTTITGNTLSAPDDVIGAGVFFFMDYGNEVEHDLDVTIHNSILAGNGGDVDCRLLYFTPGKVNFDSSNSLYGDTEENACGLDESDLNNIVNQDANLGPLADNGGPTQTHLPNPGSPAIDAGDNTLALNEIYLGLEADQRGYAPRVVNDTVDIGAVEVGATAPADPGNYVSPKGKGTTADGVVYDNSDILKLGGMGWSLVFDGSAALQFNNASNHNINAFSIDGDDIVMSFLQNGRVVPGVDPRVDGTDLVRWDGSAFTFYFDGSDVGLDKKGSEKIDGLHVLPGSESPINVGGCQAYLLISTQGPGQVIDINDATLKFSGEDVLGFCAMDLGEYTFGYWHMVFDGSDVGLPKGAINSISVEGDTLYFITTKNVKLGNVLIIPPAVYAFNMNTHELTGIHFNPEAHGMSGKVNGLQMQ